jgi:hypothetical protein
MNAARGLAAASACFLLGCGGAMPLLHPAQTLPTGDVRAVAGIAARAVVGNLGDALRIATNQSAASQMQMGSPPPTSTTYTQGALVAAGIAPDLSPIAGARVGVGAGFEGGLMYTGRGVRADLRKAFNVGNPSHWAVSVGVGIDGALSGRQTTALNGIDNANLLGIGADVPVLLGWHSTAGLYYFWVGARVQYEHDTIQPRSKESPSTMADLVGDRVGVSGLVGIAIGFRHVHVALELEAGYAYLTGSFGGVQYTARVDGLVLTPASALLWDF